ncbi:MAG TPA: ABC transporter permease [Streptosporangiaceae bacterium]|nr:ABC transporter permease [Streptosporangiaceae bacterium]
MTGDAAVAAGSGGVIHDIGYRHYDGPRLGRAAIVRSLYWHSLRSAFGIGRGAKAKVVPLLTFGIMCLPAVVNAIGAARGGGRVIPYDTYVFRLRGLVMVIFVAAQAPELVSRDLRSHVLPLYLCRPVRRLDYPLAKYAAFTAACLLMVEIPLLLLYLGTVVSASGTSAIWSQTRAFIPGLLIGVLWAVLLAATGLVLASLTGRRAYATGAIAIYFFLTWTLASILIGVSGGPGGPGGQAAPLAARLAGLVSPITVLDGVRRWLGGTSFGPVPLPGSAGVLYGAMFLLLLAASLGGLAARYRKAGLA